LYYTIRKSLQDLLISEYVAFYLVFKEVETKPNLDCLEQD